ncbi:MAG: HD domain-containing protein [Burkholderiales bacterium]|nr:HD domain-containing protein [Burkholderiales bacterium]
MACVNVTAALFSMGLYRETISVGLRTISEFKDYSDCALCVANTRSNMANAALAMSHFALAADAARESVSVLGLPRDAISLLNRVIAETVWMKAAIGLEQRAVVDERIAFIRSISAAFKAPRLQLNHQLAEAGYEMYAGDLTVAVAKLMELLKHTKAIPNLYRDNLAMLVRAYEKAQDHAGALIFLGELVEFLREKQVAAVKAGLASIEARHTTLLPGKDDVRDVIKAIQQTVPGASSRNVRNTTKGEVPEREYREAFERLAVSAELKEDVGGRHAYRMGRLAGLLAAKLGYDRKFCDEVEKGARLHDIGKLGIPDGLLLKSGELTPAEWTVMKRHTLIGAQIIRQCPHPAFRVGEQIALCHHEKWDGSGYPKGLRGDNIPVPARIVMLADVYDALTHARPYKHAWTHEDVVAYILDRAGSQFDPTYARLFVGMVDALRREHGDKLDDYLAEPSKASSFIQARDRMQEMLSEMAPLQPGEFL